MIISTVTVIAGKTSRMGVAVGTTEGLGLDWSEVVVGAGVGITGVSDGLDLVGTTSVWTGRVVGDGDPNRMDGVTPKMTAPMSKVNTTANPTKLPIMIKTM